MMSFFWVRAVVSISLFLLVVAKDVDVFDVDIEISPSPAIHGQPIFIKCVDRYDVSHAGLLTIVSKSKAKPRRYLVQYSKTPRGSNVVLDEEVKSRGAIFSAHAQKLSIPKASYFHDNADYACEVSLSTSMPFQMHYSKFQPLQVYRVKKPPVMTGLPGIRDEKNNLTCYIDDISPEPSIYWNCSHGTQDSHLTAGTALSKHQNTDGSLRYTSERVEKFVPQDDGQEIACFITVKDDPTRIITSVRRTISFDYRPVTSISIFGSRAARQGQPLTLECSVDAKPSGDIEKWTKNNEVIQNGSHYMISSDFQHLTISKLTINGDMGVFRCIATNAIGEGTCKTPFRVGTAASQASTTKANLVMYIVIPLAAVVMIAIVGALVYIQIKRSQYKNHA